MNEEKSFTKWTFSARKRSLETIIRRTENVIDKLSEKFLEYKIQLPHFFYILSLILLLTKKYHSVFIFELQNNSYAIPLFWKKENQEKYNCILFSFKSEYKYTIEYSFHKLFEKVNILLLNEDCELVKFISIQNKLYKMELFERKTKIRQRIIPKICCSCFREIVDEKYDHIEHFLFTHFPSCY